MENLLVSFNVVAPLIILMLLGMLLLRVHIFDENTVKKMNVSVFRLFLPVLIFNNMYNSSIDDVKNVGTALYTAAVIIGAFVLSAVFVSLVEKEPKKRGSMVQGMCRSNFVIFGVPLCVAISGEGVLGKVSVAVAIVVPVLNVLSVIMLEYFRGGKPDIRKMIKGIITNPLIIASLLGFLALISGIKFPKIINTSLNDVAKIATPLALILLGASIKLSALKGNIKELIISIVGKLIVIPIIGIFIAALIGMRGGDIALLIAALASPTAVSSYPMALEMGGDGELAAQIVALGTTLCIITVFLWVFVLKQVGLI